MTDDDLAATRRIVAVALVEAEGKYRSLSDFRYKDSLIRDAEAALYKLKEEMAAQEKHATEAHAQVTQLRNLLNRIGGTPIDSTQWLEFRRHLIPDPATTGNWGT